MNISEAFKLLKDDRKARHQSWKHAICLQLDVFRSLHVEPDEMINVLVAKWILGIREDEVIIPTIIVDERLYTIIGRFKSESPQKDMEAIYSLIAQHSIHLTLLEKVFELRPKNFDDDGWEVVE